MAYIYDLSDTWNAAGTTFFGIKMNVTNSASASGSKLLSLQVASTEYFGVDKDGNVTIGNGGDLNISSATGGDASKIYNDAEDLYFQTNGSTRLLINSSGNIGIGNTSPGAKLDVTGNIRLSAASPNIELNNGGPMVYSTASNTLMFGSGGGPSSPVERFRFGPSGQFGIAGANYGTSGQVLSSQGSSSAPTWLSLATVATSGSFADLSNKPGIRSNGQNVIGSSKTLGSSDNGTNILIVTSGITITFPSSGFASGEGFLISNVSGGNVTLSAPGGSDFGTTLPNNGSAVILCDGGGFWRQYCYSTARL